MFLFTHKTIEVFKMFFPLQVLNGKIKKLCRHIMVIIHFLATIVYYDKDCNMMKTIQLGLKLSLSASKVLKPPLLKQWSFKNFRISLWYYIHKFLVPPFSIIKSPPYCIIVPSHVS